MNVIGLAGLIGPVRKRAQLTYAAVCPACRGETLSIQVTPTGDLPRCSGPCSVVEIRDAFKDLAGRPDVQPAVALDRPVVSGRRDGPGRPTPTERTP